RDREARLAAEKAAAEAAKEAEKALNLQHELIVKQNKAWHSILVEVKDLAIESGGLTGDFARMLAMLDASEPALAALVREAAALATEVANSGTVVDRIFPLITNYEPLASGLAEKQVQQAAPGYEAFRDLQKDLQNAVSRGMTDGLLAGLAADNLRDGIAAFGIAFANSMSNVAASRLDIMFKTLATGGTGREAMEAAGLWNPEANGGKGGVNWGGVAQLGGGLLMSYGQQSGNRGAAMVGGAVSMGMAGYQMAGGPGNPYAWIGAVVGAIVGAVAGYFSSASKKMDVNIGSRAQGTSGSTFNIDVSGIDQEAENELVRTWFDKTKKLNSQFRELFDALKQAVPDFMVYLPEINKSVSDFSSYWKALLEHDLPAVLFGEFRPGLEAALKAVGVGDTRIAEMLSEFTAGNFDQATTELLAFVKGLFALKDASELYGKSLDTLRMEANRTPWEEWSAGLVTTQEQIGKLLTDLPKLTSEEQVARAQELLSLTQAQYEANIKMFQELEGMRTAAAGTLSQYVADRNLAAAQRGGWGASEAYLRQGFNTSRAMLNEGAIGYVDMDPQAAQRTLDDAFRYGQALASLADAMEGALPEFDALMTGFTDFQEKAAVPLADVMAKLGRGVRQAFLEDSADTIARITSLRQGLDKLAPADFVTRMQQIGQLQEEQYTRQLEYVKALASAQQQLNESIDAQLQSITENELAKQGKDVIGQYYVDQMKALWEQLQAEQDPMKAKEIADRILAFSQKLYGLDPDIMLKVGNQTMGAGSWLTGFLEQLRTFMNGKFDKAGDEAQGVANQLLLAIAGLTTGITTKKDELQASIDAIRKLVDEGLFGAVNDFNAIIGVFQQSIVADNTGLQAAINAMITAFQGAALNVNSFFGVFGSTPPGDETDPGERGGGEIPIRLIPIVDDFGTSVGHADGAVSGLATSAGSAASALELVAQRIGDLRNLTITIELPEGVEATVSDPQFARLVRRNRSGVAA
ncbi:MAG TPA: hypothetical protein PLS53_17680, partial [Thermoanaerobaculaceae bacterium]|nr:hypothetical protein [Thermoanaerobaculaceae bacterium]